MQTLMKKKSIILAATSALAVLTLAACSGDTNKDIATMKGGTITVSDFYDEAKLESSNQSLVQRMIIYKVFNNKYGDKVTDKQGASSTKTITIDVIERIVIPENKPVDKTNNDTNSSNSSKLPQTGDINNIGVLAVTLMMSGSIVIECNRKKSKANSLSEK